MKKYSYLTHLLLSLLVVLSIGSPACADALDDDLLLYEEETRLVADPLEPLNRVFFQFNDKLFFYVVNPVAKTYAAVVADDFRTSFDNAFRNLLSPIRIVNNLLQGKFEASGIELTRFVINSTLGSAGLGDAAKAGFNIEAPSEEDLGQTLGKYGLGEGIYFCWPFIGPSNLRDTIGFAGDTFLNPLTYMTFSDTRAGLGVQAGKRVNETSLRLGEYEQFIESSFDPYFAMRDYYTQSRRSKIKDKIHVSEQGSRPEPVDILSDLSLDRPEAYTAEPEMETALAAAGHGGKYSVLPPSAENGKKQFFVQVGAFTDRDNIDSMADRLTALALKPLVVEYMRDNYNFYGVLVSAGESFAHAKKAEQQLVQAGFDETIVVTH